MYLIQIVCDVEWINPAQAGVQCMFARGGKSKKRTKCTKHYCNTRNIFLKYYSSPNILELLVKLLSNGLNVTLLMNFLPLPLTKRNLAANVVQWRDFVNTVLKFVVT
jgi:hypothetical protein